MKNLPSLFTFVCLSLLLAFATTSAAQDPTTIVENAYQDVLGRKADPQGLHSFRSKIIDEGWTERQVRDALRDSAEYQQGGATKIVKHAYEDLLNREPDPAGMKMYTDHIIKDNWSEKQVRDDIRTSQEYKNKHK